MASCQVYATGCTGSVAAASPGQLQSSRNDCFGVVRLAGNSHWRWGHLNQHQADSGRSSWQDELAIDPKRRFYGPGSGPEIGRSTQSCAIAAGDQSDRHLCWAAAKGWLGIHEHNEARSRGCASRLNISNAYPDTAAFVTAAAGVVSTKRCIKRMTWPAVPCARSPECWESASAWASRSSSFAVSP